MEIFASHYLECNPDGVLDNTDTAYILSYSIIMLQTSLHNPSVKDKPDVNRFISMNRGIFKGGDLPKEFLMVRRAMWVWFSHRQGLGEKYELGLCTVVI